MPELIDAPTPASEADIISSSKIWTRCRWYCLPPGARGPYIAQQVLGNGGWTLLRETKAYGNIRLVEKVWRDGRGYFRLDISFLEIILLAIVQ